MGGRSEDLFFFFLRSPEKSSKTTTVPVFCLKNMVTLHERYFIVFGQHFNMPILALLLNKSVRKKKFEISLSSFIHKNFLTKFLSIRNSLISADIDL